MFFLKRFIDFIIFGNIYIAIGAVCLTQSTLVQLGLVHLLPYYSALVFFATLFIYNFQRIFYSAGDIDVSSSVRRIWLSKNQQAVKLLTFAGFAGVCVLFFFNDYRMAFYLSPLLLLSIAYFIPQIKLRKNFWFKLFTLVLVWVMVTAVVPMLLNREYFNTSPNALCKAGLHIAARFCFMLAICIPFDIRDMEIDAKENISTLPNKIGESKTRWIAVFAVIVYCFLLIAEVAMQVVSIPIFFALLMNMSVTLFLVLLCSSKRSEYYFTAGIDGTMLLQYLLILIVNYFSKIS